MKTLEIKLPDEVFGVLNTLAKQKDKFVVEAIREKLEREKKQNLNQLLAEGYKAAAKEDLALANDFEIDNSKKLRPFGLSKNKFVAPEDFDAPLPENILADFEN